MLTVEEESGDGVKSRGRATWMGGWGTLRFAERWRSNGTHLIVKAWRERLEGLWSAAWA